MIQTVNGRIHAGDLGITMCHEHLALDLSPVRKDDDSTFDDMELIGRELEKMVSLGVTSVIEVTCCHMGRDGKALRALSSRYGIHIVASTGYYLEAYHPRRIQDSSAEELCDEFCRDILEGMDGTDLKAGVIGEVATGEKEMGRGEEKVLKAAAMASKRTGCAVTTHCQLGKLGLEQARLLERCGADPAHVVLGHMDLAADREYYQKVLGTGVNLGFDTIGKVTYLKDETRADHLVWLLEKGFEDRIVLSQDISRKSYLSERGPYSGYMAVMKDFLPLLRQRGVDEALLNKLLIQNPARIFDPDYEREGGRK